MAIEIVDLPITSMVIFHSYVDIYQRVGSASRWHYVTIPHQAHHRSHWPSVAPPLLYRACAMAEPEPSKGKRWVIALECLGSSLLEQALKLAHTMLPWLVLDHEVFKYWTTQRTEPFQSFVENVLVQLHARQQF